MMKRKTILSLVIAAACAASLMSSGIARADANSYAPDTATLNITIQRANALCKVSADYSRFCTLGSSLTTFRDSLRGKTAAQQKAAIKANSEAGQDNFDFAKFYYTKEVQATHITDSQSIAANTSGDKAFSGDCNDGGVKLGVGINSTDECVGGKGVNPIYAYLKGIILLMGTFIGLGLVLTLVISGIQYSSSAGEPAKLAKAKERIFNAVIGVLLYIMLAAVLRYLIPNIFV